jgi:hypothetical protein
MPTAAKRKSLLHQLAERDVGAIYDMAMKRSEEIKKAALEDPEFEDKILDDAGWALRQPAADEIGHHIGAALAIVMRDGGMSLPEARIIVKRWAMDAPQRAIDETVEYMYNSRQWERPEEDDG